MLLWLAHRAWNFFCDPQEDCLGRRGAFLSHDFGLPRTGSSLAVHSGSLDPLHSFLGISSSSTWALGLRWNGSKPLEPSDPTITVKFFFFLGYPSSIDRKTQGRLDTLLISIKETNKNNINSTAYKLRKISQILKRT